MKRFIFEENVLDDFSLWAIYDKHVFQRILKLLKDIKRSPYEGIGKPEPLKYDKSGCWSRRITEEHRLVYKISDDGEYHRFIQIFWLSVAEGIIINNRSKLTTISLLSN